MFGRNKQSDNTSKFKPFVIRVKDGFLIGLALPPEAGSPCVNCVLSWLKDRDVWAEIALVSDLKIRRELLGELIAENNNHVMYEITRQGDVTRVDSVIFPHPSCRCQKTGYVGKLDWSRNTNFAFSPIFQIKCARYGTPNGNLWLTSATGEAPDSKQLITVHGVAKDRESSRAKAVDNWLKQAGTSDLSEKELLGTRFAVENFQTGKLEQGQKPSNALIEGLGAGANREEATLDALCQLAKTRTVKKFSNAMKNPMLVVGCNNWIRQNVPFFMLQQYDLHLLFYPNSTPCWVVGIAALSRVSTSELPKFMFASGPDMTEALTDALYKLLAICRPGDGKKEDGIIHHTLESKATSQKNSKLNMWWTHWIYRCPKISLKDILHLEPYPRNLNLWKEYFQDGQEPLSIVNLNHTGLPKKIRTIVKLSSPLETNQRMNNVEGIGTISNFRDAFA